MKKMHDQMVILKQMSCLFRLGGLQLSTDGFEQLHEHLCQRLLDVFSGAADERQHEIQQREALVFSRERNEAQEHVKKLLDCESEEIFHNTYKK